MMPSQQAGYFRLMNKDHSMDHSQAVWQEWITRIQSWWLANLCATLMDGLSPIALLSAQVLYLGQPIIGPFLATRQLNGLIDLLEDPQAYQVFTHELRKAAAV
jgi:hypothetical protein